VLHFKSPLLKLFPKNIEAVALFGHCFFRYEKSKVSDELINHELIHCYQMKEDGCFKFYFNYIKDYLKLRIKGYNHNDAYMNIPYEIEAYKNQGSARDNINN
jgi:hypothetical protein